MVGRRLVLTIGAGEVRALATRLGRPPWTATATYTSEADLAAVLAALAEERPPRLGSATVHVEAPLARVKIVTGLPKLRRTDLVAHVRLHSRRYFLQNGAPPVTDAEPRRDCAVLAAAHLSLVSAICDGLDAAGLECLDIVPAAHPTLSLIPDGLRAGQTRSARKRLQWWAAAAAASVIIAAGVWAATQARAEHEARAALASVAAPLQEALGVRRDLDATTGALGVLHSASDRSGTAVFLASLARALPDSAFLVTLRIENDGQVLLSGYATHATQVPPALERARLLTAPVFDGPVTRESVAGHERERFTIRGRLLATARAP